MQANCLSCREKAALAWPSYPHKNATESNRQSPASKGAWVESRAWRPRRRKGSLAVAVSEVATSQAGSSVIPPPVREAEDS